MAKTSPHVKDGATRQRCDICTSNPGKQAGFMEYAVLDSLLMAI